MSNRLARFRRVIALADNPTPGRRAIAALVAGSMAGVTIQLLFGTVLGAGNGATLFSSVAFAVAAGVTAATMKSGMAILYGMLAAIWLLVEGVVVLIGCIAAGLG